MEPHGLLCIHNMDAHVHVRTSPVQPQCWKPDSKACGLGLPRNVGNLGSMTCDWCLKLGKSCGTEPLNWSVCCFQILELACRTSSWCLQRTGWWCWTIFQGFTQIFLPYLISHPPSPFLWLSNNLVIIFFIEKIITKQKSSFLLCLHNSAISIITTEQ